MVWPDQCFPISNFAKLERRERNRIPSEFQIRMEILCICLQLAGWLEAVAAVEDGGWRPGLVILPKIYITYTS